MSLSTADVTHVLIALTLLLVAAHACGQLFTRMRQPAVIGEIIGGLLLGPTLLGAVAPGFANWVFGSSKVTTSVLGAMYQIGLLLLMFLVGAELQLRATRRERRKVALITGIGLAVPFAIGIGVAGVLSTKHYSGPHGTPLTIGLIFGIAVAVTSIPVISRILMDLDILETAFARVVLTVAVLEDVALYVVLALVLGLANTGGQGVFGLWSLGDTDDVPLTALYYVLASLAFLAVALVGGARTVFSLANSRFNLVELRNPAAFRLLVLFVAVLACTGLGINPIFGALLAGIACSRADGGDRATSETWVSLKQFAQAFFIPVYFAIVGLKLDLLHNIDLLFLVWFFTLACVTKAASVWVAARLAGEDSKSAVQLAVAMNARGGPGIVLATVTFGAGIINEKFFTILVLLSIVTSQIAGYWLDRTFRRVTEPETVKT
ncbi:cation:proton antiporter [Planotetraspora silvatica]|uniref:Cation:proton antiporter n=1 Tax=Planotetraspora silvatica TaxID=234614 RepID=A0A8J3XR57_9ACTN|nr:cation:proton antiporter [Planotetraspora silvatica]GII49101.1 cation:proton antiporter [Planotetraspora silvatica]